MNVSRVGYNQMNSGYNLRMKAKVTVASKIAAATANSPIREVVLPDSILKIREIISAEKIQELAKGLAAKINNDFNSGEEIKLVCVMNGGMPFYNDIARELKVLGRETKGYFVKSSSYGVNKVSNKNPEITVLNGSNLDELRNGNVLILDELFDTGHTLLNVLNCLKVYEPKEIKSAVMFNKVGINKETRKEVEKIEGFEPDYCGTDIENDFLIGYGLDLDETQETRDLRYVGSFVSKEMKVVGHHPYFVANNTVSK